MSELINKLSPKTSFGFDGISAKLIKSIKTPVIKPKMIAINQVINTGIFSDKLKMAKIISIFKKDDETQFTNYRPISLLPTISKIFEKIIFKQLHVNSFLIIKYFITVSMDSEKVTQLNIQH